ncbi:MAG: gamma-glutamylcyclotransferase [Ruminococcaceae bacterium]|nr:gamma-glutamylcyclotransferase [Oscillospiraceae bacterium]
MKTQYYLAYGSNLNKSQMACRCPTAFAVGSGVLDGWQLVFNRVATIIPCAGASVPVGVWKIDEACEEALDRYEGFPHFYRKEYVDLRFNGEIVTAMVYIMNGGERCAPSDYYLNTIREGYGDFCFDEGYLLDALSQ